LPKNECKRIKGGIHKIDKAKLEELTLTIVVLSLENPVSQPKGFPQIGN